jgi:hypothetical protein
MRSVLAVALVALAAIVTFTACGSESSHFTCCLNGAFYECANQQQFDSCTFTSPQNLCTRDASKDASCR